MISFKKYVSTFKKKYVCLSVDQQSQKLLAEYAQSNGFDLTLNYNGQTQQVSQFDFHVTVFYTSTYHNTKNYEIEVEPPIKLQPISIELLGENKDVPVLKIGVTDQLNGVRRLFENQGFGDKWGQWKPHISLSYNKKQIPDISKIKLPDFNIFANKMKIEDQDG